MFTPSSKDIAKPDNLNDMLTARNEILKKVRKIWKLAAEIRAICQPYSIHASNIERHDYYGGNEKQVTKAVDSEFWEALGKRFLFGAMTEKAQTDFYNRVQREAPEFVESEVTLIMGNIERLYVNTAMQTIRETYRQFINCDYRGSQGWRSKRDNLREVKVSFRCSHHLSRYSSYKSAFEDLYTVFKLLDGKGRFDYNDTMAKHLQEQTNWEREWGTIVTPYFDVTIYKNGNKLVKVKREDLLREFNRLGSTEDGDKEKQLPDHMAKRYKPEHLKNENTW